MPLSEATFLERFKTLTLKKEYLSVKIKACLPERYREPRPGGEQRLFATSGHDNRESEEAKTQEFNSATPFYTRKLDFLPFS